MSLNVKEALKYGIGFLAGSPTSELDSRILLGIASQMNREDIILNPLKSLTSEQEKEYLGLLERRNKGEPIAYIVGYKEFYGLNFVVSRDVLIPRPDSEILVEATLEYAKKHFDQSHEIKILDICTGSGALLISIFANLQKKNNFKGIGIDISKEALQIAKVNRRLLLPSEAQVYFLEADVFDEGLSLEADLVISNPPYIKEKDISVLIPDVKDFEPLIALNGGDDGLLFYKELARKCLNSKTVILEIGMGQESDVTNIFNEQGYKLVDSFKDYGGITRVLIFKIF
jgi:release factor glutamine methyltransferase